MFKEILLSTAKHVEPTYASIGELEYIHTMESYTTVAVHEPIRATSSLCHSARMERKARPIPHYPCQWAYLEVTTLLL